jgi:hypothetical protein
LLVALIGLLGYFIKYYLDMRFDKRRKRVEAAQKFRDSFLKELMGLYPLPTECGF